MRKKTQVVRRLIKAARLGRRFLELSTVLNLSVSLPGVSGVNALSVTAVWRSSVGWLSTHGYACCLSLSLPNIPFVPPPSLFPLFPCFLQIPCRPRPRPTPDRGWAVPALALALLIDSVSSAPSFLATHVCFPISSPCLCREAFPKPCDLISAASTRPPGKPAAAARSPRTPPSDLCSEALFRVPET